MSCISKTTFEVPEKPEELSKEELLIKFRELLVQLQKIETSGRQSYLENIIRKSSVFPRCEVRAKDFGKLFYLEVTTGMFGFGFAPSGIAILAECSGSQTEPGLIHVFSVRILFCIGKEPEKEEMNREINGNNFLIKEINGFKYVDGYCAIYFNEETKSLCVKKKSFQFDFESVQEMLSGFNTHLPEFRDRQQNIHLVRHGYHVESNTNSCSISPEKDFRKIEVVNIPDV